MSENSGVVDQKSPEVAIFPQTQQLITDRISKANCRFTTEGIFFVLRILICFRPLIFFQNKGLLVQNFTSIDKNFSTKRFSNNFSTAEKFMVGLLPSVSTTTPLAGGELTAGEVREIVRRSQDGGAVPASIGEEFLAHVYGVTWRTHHARHQIEPRLTQTPLLADQTQRPRPRAVCRRVPRQLTTLARRQTSANTAASNYTILH